MKSWRDWARKGFEGIGLVAGCGKHSPHAEAPAPPIHESGYLESMTPAQEPAAFLSIRGASLQENGRAHEAQQAFAMATRLAPQCRLYQKLAAGTADGVPPPRAVASATRPSQAKSLLPRPHESPPERNVFPKLERNPLREFNQPKH